LSRPDFPFTASALVSLAPLASLTSLTSLISQASLYYAASYQLPDGASQQPDYAASYQLPDDAW
jgi:hypothetical protein